MSGKPSWLGYAEDDLRSAQALAHDTDPAWHLVAYLSQQCAEKCLKAFLLANGWSFKKTHDTAELLDESKKTDPTLNSLDSDCDLLTAFVQVGRYPLRPVTSKDAHDALAAATRVSVEIRKRLGSKLI